GTAPPDEGLAVLCERLRNSSPVLVRNLTSPMLAGKGLDWRVVKVTVPGLQPLHADDRFAHLGGQLWLPRALEEWSEAPPHPFPIGGWHRIPRTVPCNVRTLVDAIRRLPFRPRRKLPLPTGFIRQPPGVDAVRALSGPNQRRRDSIRAGRRLRPCGSQIRRWRTSVPAD